MGGFESIAVIIATDHNRDVSKLETPANVIDVEPSRASGDHFVKLQICSNTPQNPSRSLNFSPLHSKLSESTEPSFSCKTHLSNPIAQAFRELEPGKAFLPYIMSMATILLAVHNKDSSPHVFYSSLCLLCAALVALLYGNSLREIFPKTANAFEQFGAACIYTSLFMVVGSHLPLAYVWFPLVCFLACIGLSAFSCLPVKMDFVNPTTRLPI